MPDGLPDSTVYPVSEIDIETLFVAGAVNFSGEVLSGQQAKDPFAISMLQFHTFGHGQSQLDEPVVHERQAAFDAVAHRIAVLIAQKRRQAVPRDILNLPVACDVSAMNLKGKNMPPTEKPDRVSASKIVRPEHRTLQERGSAIENWLREEVAPVYDAMRRDPGRAIPAQAAFDRIRDHHADRLEAQRDAGGFIYLDRKPPTGK